MKIQFLYFILFIQIILGCNHYSTSEELIKKFYEEKPHLDTIVNRLNRDKKFDSAFHIEPYTGLPNIKNSYPHELQILKKIGIIGASAHPNTCGRWCPHWYLFTTDWPSEHPIMLIYNFDNTSESVKGFYTIDKYKNETWGLGDNWKMFRFVDTITDIKY